MFINQKNLPSISDGSKFFHFHAVSGKTFTKQECIPVGCVPLAAVVFRGVLHQAPPPPETRHPPWDQTPPGPGTPFGPGTPPLLWTE